MDLGVNDSGKPYEQVAASLRKRIAAGEFAVGTQLRINRELATEYGVSANTVGSAIGVLRREGIVSSQQGRGTFVRATPEGAEPGRPSPEFVAVIEQLDQVQEQLEAMNARLRRLEDAVPMLAEDEAAPQAQ